MRHVLLTHRNAMCTFHSIDNAMPGGKQMEQQQKPRSGTSAGTAQQTKRFHLGDVLSITTGKLISPTLMDGIYSILNHMTGDSLFTHQLPRAIRECMPHLLAQFPELADVQVEGVTPENHKQRLADLVAAHGEWFDVAPLAANVHEHRDPIAEAVEMFGADRVIVATGAEAQQ